MYQMYVVIAIAQIIIEMIPISSSGHIGLLRKYGIFNGDVPQDWIVPDWFEYMLHIPTIFVVLLFFRSDWWSLKRRLFIIVQDFFWLKKELRWAQKKWLSMVLKLPGYVLLADLITSILFFSCEKIFVCGLYNWQQLLGFIITAASLFSLKIAYKKRMTWCSWHDAVLMGIAQGGAKLLSCSRFGITLATAHALGFSFRRSIQFSFLLFFPLMCAAGLKGILTMPVQASQQVVFDIPFLVAIILASCVSYFFLYGIYWLGQRGYLWYLGFYMLIPISAMIFLQFNH